MRTNTYDAVVIGAGIVGAATAYYLTREGLNVAIVDRDRPATQASGFAFGMVSAPFTTDAHSSATERLLSRSAALHNLLPDELTEAGAKPYHCLKKAGIRLALNELEAAELKRIGVAGFQRTAANVSDRQDLRWLEYGALSHIEARISDKIPGGLYMGGQLEVAPDGVTTALVQAAESSGQASLLTGEVSKIEVENGQVRGIQVGDEVIGSPSVVLAAGPWCSEILARSPGANHIRLQVAPLKGQIVRFDIGDETSMPVSLWWGSDYAATKPDGLLYAGTTEEHAGFDTSVTGDAEFGITQSVARVLPFVADATVAHQTACLRPVTPDGLPMVGAVDGIDGLVVATGGGRSGIELGPGMGELASLFATDRTSADRLGYGDLNPNRFN